MTPYKIDTPLRRIVCGWKVITGYTKDDRAWDKAHFARTLRSAKILYEFLGSDDDAIDCMQDVYEHLLSKGLTCTIETCVKHSADWKIRHEQNERV